ncbi:MAG: radical SAM protein [Deltaproteobacteria bacterium]|nr:radical SAM protein [Deltaproteobacteria bacterium]
MKSPFIIPVFIPNMGCPHQCIFCDQSVITNTESNRITPKKIEETVDNWLLYRKDNNVETQLSFYGGNFLGLAENLLLSLLNKAEGLVSAKKIDSIRFSTRPDTVTPEILKFLKKYSVKTIEIGAQSMDDEVLKHSGRGHNAADSIEAGSLIKNNNFELGLQMMTGLPKDTKEKSLHTAKKIAELKPDFVRIYPCIVLKGSPLETLLKKGLYKPQTLQESVDVVKPAYLMFKEKNIRVIRMGLQASEELKPDSKMAAGPYHPAYGHLVLSAVYFDIASDIIKEKRFNNKEINIVINPRDISIVLGIKKENIIKLKNRFDLKGISIIQDNSIDRWKPVVRERGEE